MVKDWVFCSGLRVKDWGLGFRIFLFRVVGLGLFFFLQGCGFRIGVFVQGLGLRIGL